MNEYRLLNIMIEKVHTSEDSFGKEIITALREYADALERNTGMEIKSINGEVQCFYSSNHCAVKVIHGSDYIS